MASGKESGLPLEKVVEKRTASGGDDSKAGTSKDAENGDGKESDGASEKKTSKADPSGKKDMGGGKRKTKKKPKKKPKFAFKVLVVGESGTGKTALVNRYINDVFYNYRSTEGFHLLTREIEREDCVIVLNIIDVSGNEGTSIIRGSYYVGCTGVILVYDTTKEGSFGQTIIWTEKIRERVTLAGGRLVPCVLLLTKCDEGHISTSAERLIRTVFCKEHYVADVIRTSAKTNMNITEAFEVLIDEMIWHYEGNENIRDARIDPLVIHDPQIRRTEIRRKRWWHF